MKSARTAADRDAAILDELKGIRTLLEERLPLAEGQATTELDAAPEWMQVAEGLKGLHEIDDNEELQDFLGCDPELTPWCAAFVNQCLQEAGHTGIGSLRARDFADWGEECDKKDGAVAVFKSHVGFVKGEKLLGGNQGNMVKESNLDWYHKNMEFLGYRWPVA